MTATRPDTRPTATEPIPAPGESTAQDRAGDRVVWRGRLVEHDGLDGWNCDRSTLMRRLEAAAELVVLDALSFPWESLTRAHETLPLVVHLPEELDADQIDLTFRDPLRDRFTPLDRLVERRAEVRRRLTELWGLAESAWADLDDLAGPDLRDRLAKERWLFLRDRVHAALRDCLDEVIADPPRVDALGVDREAVADAVRRLGEEVRLQPVGHPDDVESPSSHVVVAGLGDDADAWADELGAAYRRTKPSGHLVVVATLDPSHRSDVLDSPLTRLVAAVDDATGLTVQLTEFRTVTWPGHQFASGVVLTLTSLRTGEAGTR